MTDQEKAVARAALFAETGKITGYTVMWRNQGASTSGDIISALKSLGLDEKVFKDLSPRNAFSRACNEMEKERAIDKLDSAPGTASFQFTAKHLKDSRVDYSFEAVVTLDTVTGVVTCEASPGLAFYAQKLLDEKVAVRTANDVTRVVQRLFEKSADIFPLIPESGGVYFVPWQYRKFIDTMRLFVERLGGKFIALPIPSGDVSANKAITDAVAEGMESVIAELNEAAKSWDDTTREGTKERALQKWEVANFKASHYAELLQDKSAAIIQKLAETKELIRAKFVEQVS